MAEQSAFQLTLDFLTSKPVVVGASAAQISSDAGLLPFRQLDEQLGLTRQFAAALTDRRHVGYLGHTFLEMTRMRVYGILADYPDQNDHDVLRSDPIFKLICDRLPQGNELASQPTLSRFENAIGTHSFFRLRDVLIDQFIASFCTPPKHLTLDIDPFDDPTHGQQQLTFFHGYYDQYQYLPRAITCAENDLVVCVCLLHGTAHPALGAADDGYADRGESENRNKELKARVQADRLSDHRYSPTGGSSTTGGTASCHGRPGRRNGFAVLAGMV